LAASRSAAGVLWHFSVRWGRVDRARRSHNSISLSPVPATGELWRRTRNLRQAVVRLDG